MFKGTNISDVISLWKPSGNTLPDPSWVDLSQLDFFRQFQVFTEQYLFIFDHATMRYLFISDNVGSDLGFPIAEMLTHGIAAAAPLFHPDDIEKLGVISALMNNRMKALRVDQVMECRFTFDHRMRDGNGRYRRLLQHNIPLTVDENRSIGYVLILATDISSYKYQNYSAYKVVQYCEGLPNTLMEGMIGGKRTETITKRELEVIKSISDGLSEKEIARKLFVSPETIKTHRKNLIRKTGVRNSVELVRWAMAHLYI